MLELLLVALKREVVRLSDITEAYTQNAIQTFMKRFNIQNMAIIAIVIAVIIVAVLFWPQISGFFGVGTKALSGAIPVPNEASVPIR